VPIQAKRWQHKAGGRIARGSIWAEKTHSCAGAKGVVARKDHARWGLNGKGAFRREEAAADIAMCCRENRFRPQKCRKSVIRIHVQNSVHRTRTSQRFLKPGVSKAVGVTNSRLQRYRRPGMRNSTRTSRAICPLFARLACALRSPRPKIVGASTTLRLDQKTSSLPLYGTSARSYTLPRRLRYQTRAIPDSQSTLFLI